MKFAVALNAGYPPEEFRRIVHMAERLGFSQVWVADEGLYRDPYATLTLAALSTSRVRLGLGVTNPYTRHPALTAAAAATVDEISDGRMVLGLGVGGSGPLALGRRKPRPLAAMRDTIAIVNALTAGGLVEYAGEVHAFRGQLDFRPHRRVPVFVGTRDPHVLELAGELADGVILGSLATPDLIRDAMRHIEAGARRSGREMKHLQLVSWLATSISPDPAAAADAVRSFVAVAVLTSRRLVPAIASTLPGEVRAFLEGHGWVRSRETVEAVQTGLSREHFDSFALLGSVERCRAQIETLTALPLAQVSLLLVAPRGSTIEEQMELFAGGVMGAVHA